MTSTADSATRPAWIITGPTSGIGHRTALELAAHGTVVLVGRSATRLAGVAAEIEARGGHAVSVVADMADLGSVADAAEQIVALELPLAGLLNNAGIFPLEAQTAPNGWDLTFTTDYLGPFALTEALVPHLPDGANVVFIVSAAEDPGRRFAVMAGFRGGRFASVQQSVRGEWAPGGSSRPGFDAYATAKQCSLAAVSALAGELPRVRVNAIEPGLILTTGLSSDTPPALRAVARAVTPLVARLKYMSSEPRAARMITGLLTGAATGTGGYYDENGRPMTGSPQVRDPAFCDRVVAETRALLAGAGDS